MTCVAVVTFAGGRVTDVVAVTKNLPQNRCPSAFFRFCEYFLGVRATIRILGFAMNLVLVVPFKGQFLRYPGKISPTRSKTGGRGCSQDSVSPARRADRAPLALWPNSRHCAAAPRGRAVAFSLADRAAPRLRCLFTQRPRKGCRRPDSIREECPRSHSLCYPESSRAVFIGAGNAWLRLSS